MKYLNFLILLWVISSVWNIGALNAYFRESRWYAGEDYRHRKQDLSMAIFIGCTPLSILFVPAVTGGYVDGWSLSMEPVNEESAK